ncbi:MAG TPA: hypothetical protein VK364_09170, partial [Hymenobacter sp.]|nr:hypothetical protein [Hymenobacter sp.]
MLDTLGGGFLSWVVGLGKVGRVVIQPDSTPSPVASSMVRFAPGAGLVCSGSSVGSASSAHLDTIGKSSSAPAEGLPPAVLAGIKSAVDGLRGKRRRFWLQSAARELLPHEAVSYCLRRPIPGVASVDVWHSPGDPAVGRPASAMLGGVQTCDSVWHCPVCQA